MKFVIYKNDKEVIVTTKKKERELLEECFGKNGDRDLEDYDRDESIDIGVCISARLFREW